MTEMAFIKEGQKGQGGGLTDFRRFLAFIWHLTIHIVYLTNQGGDTK